MLLIRYLCDQVDNLVTGACLWIVEWKTLVFHTQEVKNDGFLFTIDLSTPNQYLGGDRC